MEKTVEEEGKKPEEKCLELEDMVVECTLDKVEDALRVSIKHLQCLKKIVKKGREGKKEFFSKMCAFYIMLLGMKEKKLMPGEWLERKLSFLQTHCKGTKMDIIVNIIKECMRDVYPNVPIFLSEEGYRGFSTSGVSVFGGVVESDVGKFEGFDMDKDLLKVKEERYRIKSQDDR